MSHGGDLFSLGDGVASEPSFDVALRGYDKRQVENYVARAESDIATPLAIASSKRMPKAKWR